MSISGNEVKVAAGDDACHAFTYDHVHVTLWACLSHAVPKAPPAFVSKTGMEVTLHCDIVMPLAIRVHAGACIHTAGCFRGGPLLTIIMQENVSEVLPRLSRIKAPSSSV